MAKLVFDENNLTIGDLEDFEDTTGLELQDALKPVSARDEDGKVIRHDCSTSDDCEEPCKENGRPEMTVKIKPKILKALVWIANRHDDENFSLDDARKVRVTELEIIRESDDEGGANGADPKD